MKYSIHTIELDSDKTNDEIAKHIVEAIREGKDIIVPENSVKIIMKDNETGELIEVGYNKAIKKIFKELEEIKQILTNKK